VSDSCSCRLCVKRASWVVDIEEPEGERALDVSLEKRSSRAEVRVWRERRVDEAGGCGCDCSCGRVFGDGDGRDIA